MNLPVKTCLRAGLTVFFLYLAIHYWPAVNGFLATVLGACLPLFIGGALAYVLNLLMAFYERHYFPQSTNPRLIKSRRGVCLTAAIFSLLAIVTLVVWLIVPELVNCVELLISQLPGAIEQGIAYLDTVPFFSEDLIDTLSGIDWQSKIGDLVNVITSGMGNVLDVLINTVSSVISMVVTALLAIIFALYLLVSRDKLQRQSKRLLQHCLKPHHYTKLMYVLNVLNNAFHKFITGQCIEAVILGALCAIGMAILRLPYTTMISALIAFTALIPVAGAYIGAAVGVFMIATVSPMQSLIFLIFLVILQQLEGNLIYPKVVGTSLGLPGIWVLAAVTVGGGVMGIIGMLLGVPLAAAAYTLLRNELNKTAEPVKAEPSAKEHEE